MRIKNILTISLVLFISNLQAQKNNTTTHTITNVQQQVKTSNTGTVKFSFANRQYTYGTQLLKGKEGIYLFTVGLQDMAESNLNIILASIAEGKHSTIDSDNKKKSTAIINGNAYEIRGTVTFTKKGSKLSASFEFDAFPVPKNKSKADKTSTGKITGTITNVTAI